MKGSRVQAVTRELAGERIDIVPWSAESSLLISRALSPAEVNSIVLHPEKGEATVIVNDDQLSKAIGKEGKTVRLAAKLTEWKIDLVSSREHQIRQRVTDEMSMKLVEMTGITERLAGLLAEAGLTSIERLARAKPDELLDISGIGPKTAEALQATASATLDELARMIEETVAEELAKAEEEEKPLFDESIFGDEAEIVTEETSDSDLPDVPEVQEEVVVEGDPFRAFDDMVEPEEQPEEVTPEPAETVDPFKGGELEE